MLLHVNKFNKNKLKNIYNIKITQKIIDKIYVQNAGRYNIYLKINISFLKIQKKNSLMILNRFIYKSFFGEKKS